MRRLLYLATIAVFALLLVPVAWAQTQGESQSQGVVATPVPETRSIKIRDNSFEPASATVTPGTTLMWINHGQEHTVTANDGHFDSGVLNPRDIFVVTVEGSGTLTYRCPSHPEMTGSFTVASPATGDASGDATDNAATEEAPAA